MMLKIKKVEIEGFRGFTGKTTFNFDSPVTILYGGNHQGKSSVLNAIEWCLYGDECIGQSSGIRERVGTGDMSWRVVNDNSEKAFVKLEIEKEQKKYSIIRKELKGKGKKGKSIEINLPDGKEKKDAESDREIKRLLGIEFKDFANTAYQHQETIHDFVMQKPSDQSDAMDRLLGLSDYRNILEGIKKSDISKIQKDLAERFDEFQKLVQMKVEIRQENLNEKKSEAEERGLNEEELNEKKLFELIVKITREIKNFANLLGLKEKEIEPPVDWKHAKSFISEVDREIERLWSEAPDVKRQSELQDRKNSIVSLQSQYKTHYQTFKSMGRELQDFKQKNGSRDKIKNEIERMNEMVNKVEKEIKKISPKAKLIEEGISILESEVPSGSVVCPLCGKEAPNLLEHLKNMGRGKIESKVQELKKQQEEIEKKKRNFRGLVEEYNRLDEDFKREKEKLGEKIQNISEFLDRELSDKDDPAVLLSKEITNIDSDLEDIEEAVKNKLAKMNAIDEKTRTIDLLYEILLLRNRIEEINQIQNTEEFKRQEEIRTEASSIVTDIEKTRDHIKHILRKEAEEKVDKARDSIDKYFRRITNNPAFQEFKIKVEEDKRTGGNFYIFEDQDGKRPIPVLSQGDLNSLALSIVLGLSIATEDSHTIGFILMDDPSQSLDMQQKARLVEIFNELNEVKDIIVSTMDNELQQSLKNNLTKVKTIYNFSGWKPDAGPWITKGE